MGIHYNQDSDLLDYLLDPAVFTFADGFIERTDRPGLGVEVDEAAVRAADAHRTPVAHAGVAARRRLLRRVVNRSAKDRRASTCISLCIVANWTGHR